MGRHLTMTKQKIENMKQQGRGQGEFGEYIPWLMVDDFPSLGRCNRIRDIRSGRIHHFFSDLEMEYYFILAWNDEIIDIREQFPLDTSKTDEIASRLGYSHPHNKDGSDYVMTTDFLITYQPLGTHENQYFARSVKMRNSLSNKRTLQKQQIEMLYWKNINVPWKCVTENSFSIQRSKNIRKALSYYNYSFLPNKHLEKSLQLELLKEILNNPDEKLSSICNNVQIKFDLQAGGGLSLFYFLIAHKIIEVDMDMHFLPTMPIKSFVMLNNLKRQIYLMEGETFEANG